MELLYKIIILIEDKRFYRHHGIDLFAILRAFFINLRHLSYRQGGSTITQQLARNIYLSSEKTVWRKLKEVFIAVWLEFNLTKAQILKTYVENVYMGHHQGKPIIGMENASLCFWGLKLEETNYVQKIILVAMLKGPNKYALGSQELRDRTACVWDKVNESRILRFDKHGYLL